MARLVPWALGLMTLSLAACGEAPYYRQAMAGHLDIIENREPIEILLHDGQTDPALAERLKEVQSLLGFAHEQLSLPDEGSYRNYVDLGRPYVTWNVFAAPALSLEPIQWCFPFAGCVPYRGYFHEEEARAYARGLKEKGYDVSVQGATAYSTLGWFDDPVLSSMLGHGELFLAETLFHELAHQRIYVKDDAPFNESFAVVVQEDGVRRWLQHTGSPPELGRYEQLLRRRQEFHRLVERSQERLRDVYALAVDDDEKLRLKRLTFEDLRIEYAALKSRWGGLSGYDHWFDQGLNNARLASLATYQELVPSFFRLLDRCDGELDRFYRAVERLGSLDPEVRQRRLEDLQGCSEPGQPGQTSHAALSMSTGRGTHGEQEDSGW